MRRSFRAIAVRNAHSSARLDDAASRGRRRGLVGALVRCVVVDIDADSGKAPLALALERREHAVAPEPGVGEQAARRAVLIACECEQEVLRLDGRRAERQCLLASGRHDCGARVRVEAFEHQRPGSSRPPSASRRACFL